MKGLFLLITLFIFYHISFSQVYYENDSCCLSQFRGKNFDEVEILELTRDFIRLSAQNDLCCDAINSDLYKIMCWFEKKLGTEGTDISQVIKYMGMPNGTEKELLLADIELEEEEKALVYFWRGYHDFLYFVYKDNKVKYAEWFIIDE
jgi:hypothetical protein